MVAKRSKQWARASALICALCLTLALALWPSAGAQAASVAMAAQDAPVITVGRTCPATLLDDGSVGITATISSPAALSAVAVIDDVGTPDNPADDIALTIQDGDVNGDGVLDPNETWTLSGAFVAGADAGGDTVSASGTDGDGNAVSGASACDALPDGAVAAPSTPAGTGETQPTDATATQATPPGDFHVADVVPTVTIDKTTADDSISVNDQASFDITITNTGSVPAYDVEVNDLLPGGFGEDLVWQLDTGSTSAACTITGDAGAQTLNCNEAELDAGEHVVAHIVATTTFSDCGEIDNQARVRWAASPGDEPVAWVPSGDVVIDVDCPSFVVEVAADQTSILAGQSAAYTITVFHTNVEDSYSGANLTAELPGGVSWEVDDTDDCTISGGTLECGFEGPAPGGSLQIHLSGDTASDNCGQTLTVSASVSGQETSSFAPAASGFYKMPLAFSVGTTKAATGTLNQLGETSEASVTVACTDVTISKSASPDTISAGDDAVYTITVHNGGGATAHNVTVEDVPPAGPDWQTPEGCEFGTEETLTCSLSDIPANGDATITLTGATDSGDCGEISNSAAVSASNEASGDQENNDSNSASITVQCADLALAMDGNPATISAGNTIGFLLTMSNPGPGDAVDVTLSDPLPAGFDWETDDSNCAIGDGFLTCTYERLAAGDNQLVRIHASTSAADCGEVTNASATVYSPNEPEGATGDNTAAATVTINCPDLVVSKTAESGTISSGDDAVYTITVHNQGEGTAYGVKAYDTLPDDVDWQTPDGCNLVEGAISCDLPDLAANDEATITLTGPTYNAVCDTISNTASVSATNEAEEDQGNNDSDPATITIQCPDLTLTKAGAPATIAAGDTAKFVMTIGNDGPGDAVDVSLHDPFPAGLSWTPDDSSCSTDDNTLNCHFDRVAAGATQIVTISAPTTADGCGTISNEDASVYSPNEPEGHGGDNDASATITVECPDLALTKTAMAETVTSGDPAVFTIVVANNGDGVARAVTLTDNLPDGIDWAVDHAGCTIAPDTGTAGQVLSCDFDDLAAETAQTVIVSGATNGTNCGSIDNSASVTATNEADDALTNNQDDATLTVVCPHLTITKSAADGEIAPGDTAAYTITVTNDGDGTAWSVAITDDLPAGITWTLPTPTEDCTIDGASLRCNLERLAAGEEFSVTVSGATSATACGSLTNQATVSAANSDAVVSDPATITMTCPAGLAVTKTADADAVAAGADIGFTITVTNNGLGAATGVTLADTLPVNDGLAWTIDTSQSDDGCQIADGTLSCDFGSLDPSASRTVHIVSPTTDASCGTVSNSVTGAATNEAEADQADDTAAADITITCTPAIAVIKTATDGLGTEIDTADVGDTITYVYDITNTGGVPLSDITLTDDHFSDAGNLCPADTTLAANDGVDGSGDDEIVCTADYLVGETDTTDADGLVLTNSATVSGQPAVGEAVTATDDATVNINEVLTPCGFPVTFTFTDDIPFTTKGTDDVAFTLPAGFTLILDPGEQIKDGDQIIGCEQPFTIAGSPSGEPVLATGKMKLYLQQPSAGAGGLRALASDATLVVEVTEVTSWSVPSVPAPKAEVGAPTATISVSGPVLQIESGNAEAVITVEPELEIPPTKKVYTISQPVPPSTGTGPSMERSRQGLAGGLLTLLPLLAVVWMRRRGWSLF